MSIKKRGRIFYLYLVIDGVKIRESLRTTDWRLANDLCKRRIAELNGRVPNASKHQKDFGKMRISDAVEAYLAERSNSLAENSISYIRNQARPLIKSKSLGHLQLKKITNLNIVAYQSERLSKGLAPKTVNGEVSVLRQLLKHARLWYRIEDDHKPIRNHKQPVGWALTDEELSVLLFTASQRPDWKYAYTAIVLGFCCGLRACEVKALKWKDIDFDAKEIAIRRSKTPAGHRTPSMNSICARVLYDLKQDVKMLNADEPEHYVFPWHGKNQKIDPTKPMTAWRSAFRSIRKKAGLPTLRFHDGRHTVVTKLAESRQSDWVIQAQVGHVDATMMKTYSHIRRHALNQAADILDVSGHTATEPKEGIPLLG